MTRLKICGLMNRADVRLCAAAGADMLGFVTDYPVPVPWQLTRQEAKVLLASVPPTVRSCIVTGGDAEDIVALAVELRPDYIQLHYKESLAATRYVAETLLAYGIGTIKAVTVREDGSCEMPGFSSVAGAVAALADSKLAAILADSRCAASPASPSRQLDLELCREIVSISRKPLILSGGITEDNLATLLTRAAPFGVDILTGTEDAPGKKSRSKIEGLCRILRRKSQVRSAIDLSLLPPDAGSARPDRFHKKM